MSTETADDRRPRHGDTSPVAEMLIGRAVRLARTDIDTQLAAGELIRAARSDLTLLQQARETIAHRWLVTDAGALAARALVPLQTAERTLEEERRAWAHRT